LSDSAARVHDGDQAGRRLDRADCLERRSPRYMGVAASSAINTWRIPDATKHETPPCAVGCLAMSRLLFISRHAHEPSHALPALPRECARAAGCLAVWAIHAHCFSPVIYNETLCRYTSRNFPSFRAKTASAGPSPLSRSARSGRLAITAYRKNNKPARGPGVTASKSLS
jgi:hypothetical protein